MKRAELFDTYVKAKMTKFFGFVTENTEILFATTLEGP
jgi:hypothetical protein